MTEPFSSSIKRGVGAVLWVGVVLTCFPAALYEVSWNVAKVLSAPRPPAFPNLPAFQNFLAICWFIVGFHGRPLCAVAIVLDIVLVLWRGLSVWLKMIASILIVLALLGTALIEAQVKHGRQYQ
jgi:hypothetical protein